MSTSIAAAASLSGAAASMGGLGSIPFTAAHVSKPHEGMISECELYNRVPPHLQRKALKVIAAKLALAIRCDYVNLESGRARNNASGIKFRAEIEKKFAKLEEPDMAPVNKALPKRVEIPNEVEKESYSNFCGIILAMMMMTIMMEHHDNAIPSQARQNRDCPECMHVVFAC